MSIGSESNHTLEEYDENKITSIVAGITETQILKEKWNGKIFFSSL